MVGDHVGILSVVIFVTCCSFCFPKQYASNTTGHIKIIKHSLMHLLSLWLTEYHKHSILMSWGREENEIILTFTALFSYFLVTKKDLIGGVFYLFHWELRSWCSSWRGRLGWKLLLIFSLSATRNLCFTFICIHHFIQNILAVPGRCRNVICYLVIAHHLMLIGYTNPELTCWKHYCLFWKE